MIPLPESIYQQMAETLRAITTGGSIWLASLIHLPIFRESYNIKLPNMDLYVGMSCSGIRYLLSYFVFSLAYAFLLKRRTAARILTVCASFPISIAASILRLTVIYLSVYFIGPFMAAHGPHILLSWSVFLVVLVVAVAVDQGLSRRLEGKPKAGRLE
jgi:exosortase